MVKLDNTFESNMIKIGESQEDNDQIISEASQTDIWFHLENLPSCHVIISCDKKNPISKEMIKHCANLCKINGKYKNHKKLRVNYCPTKNIKKTDVQGQVIIKSKPSSICI